MTIFNKKGERALITIEKSTERTIQMCCPENGCVFSVSRSGLLNHGFSDDSLYDGAQLDAFVHADYNGSGKLMVYPYRSGDAVHKRSGMDNGPAAPAKKIENMIWSPESEVIEDKANPNQLDAIAETAAAFYNAHGGTIRIGVSDHPKTTVGIEGGSTIAEFNSDEVTRKIMLFIKSVTTGTLYQEINFDYQVVDNHVVAFVKVPKGKTVVYYRGRLVRRVLATNMTLQGQDITSFFQENIDRLKS